MLVTTRERTVTRGAYRRPALSRWAPREAPRYGDVGEAAASVVTSIVREVDVRSTLTPNVSVDLHAPSDPRTGRFMRFLKPTFVFQTIAGPVTIAPYGEATELTRELGNWALYVGLGIAAYTSAAILVGYKLGKG